MTKPTTINGLKKQAKQGKQPNIAMKTKTEELVRKKTIKGIKSPLFC